MGKDYWISWFGNRSLDELYEIKENEWDSLSEEKRNGLLKAIARKENEQANSEVQD